MGSSKKLKVPCYIGQTRTKAGIFLSTKIARRKPYGKYLRLEEYTDFSEALRTFNEQFRDVLGEEKIKLNFLYQVRDEELYSVFSTPRYVGIVRTDYAWKEAKRLLPTGIESPWWKHYLTYQEAQRIASERFVKYWNNPQLYIHYWIRAHSIMTLDEAKSQNGVL